jgi:hypothetical protein
MSDLIERLRAYSSGPLWTDADIKDAAMQEAASEIERLYECLRECDVLCRKLGTVLRNATSTNE